MRKTRLVIQPTRCLHTIGFLLIYMSFPVFGDWGLIQPDSATSHRAIALQREGARTLMKDPPSARVEGAPDEYSKCRLRDTQNQESQETRAMCFRYEKNHERWLEGRLNRQSAEPNHRARNLPEHYLRRKIPTTTRRENWVLPTRRLLVTREHETSRQERNRPFSGDHQENRSPAKRRLVREHDSLNRITLSEKLVQPPRHVTTTSRRLVKNAEMDKRMTVATERVATFQERRLLLARSTRSPETREGRQSERGSAQKPRNSRILKPEQISVGHTPINYNVRKVVRAAKSNDAQRGATMRRIVKKTQGPHEERIIGVVRSNRAEQTDAHLVRSADIMRSSIERLELSRSNDQLQHATEKSQVHLVRSIDLALERSKDSLQKIRTSAVTNAIRTITERQYLARRSTDQRGISLSRGSDRPQRSEQWITGRREARVARPTQVEQREMRQEQSSYSARHRKHPRVRVTLKNIADHRERSIERPEVRAERFVDHPQRFTTRQTVNVNQRREVRLTQTLDSQERRETTATRSRSVEGRELAALPFSDASQRRTDRRENTLARSTGTTTGSQRREVRAARSTDLGKLATLRRETRDAAQVRLSIARREVRPMQSTDQPQRFTDWRESQISRTAYPTQRLTQQREIRLARFIDSEEHRHWHEATVVTSSYLQRNAAQREVWVARTSNARLRELGRQEHRVSRMQVSAQRQAYVELHFRVSNERKEIRSPQSTDFSQQSKERRHHTVVSSGLHRFYERQETLSAHSLVAARQSTEPREHRVASRVEREIRTARYDRQAQFNDARRLNLRSAGSVERATEQRDMKNRRIQRSSQRREVRVDQSSDSVKRSVERREGRGVRSPVERRSTNDGHRSAKKQKVTGSPDRKGTIIQSEQLRLVTESDFYENATNNKQTRGNNERMDIADEIPKPNTDQHGSANTPFFGKGHYSSTNVEELFAERAYNWPAYKEIASDCVLGAVLLFLTMQQQKTAY